MYTLVFDGLFRRIPNTPPDVHAGFMGYGWVIFKGNLPVATGHGVVGRSKNATSGVAEYLAVLEGLEALCDMGLRDEVVVVSGDAKFIIDQVLGHSSISSPVIKPLYRQVMRLSRRFTNLHWKWTKRSRNRLADALTRHAFRKVHEDPGQYQAALNALQQPETHQTNQLMPLVDLRVFRSSGVELATMMSF